MGWKRGALVDSQALTSYLASGKRLEDICSLLGKNDLACVRALSERFAELHLHRPFVAKIEIRPIKQDEPNFAPWIGI